MGTLFDLSNLTIQSFDDNLERKGSHKLKSKLARIFPFDLEVIEGLQKEGAGIFFVPNHQDKSGQRGILNTKEFKFLSLDLDVTKEGAQAGVSEVAALKKDLFAKLIELKVKPNIIVVTKNGLQPVWEFSNPKKLNTDEERIDANNLYRRMVLGVTKVLGHSSEGDSLSRVIRYPNTDHLKDQKNPFQISSRETSTTHPTFESFMAAYPPAAMNEIKNPYAEILKGVDEGSRWEMATRLLGRWLKIHRPEEFESVVWPMFQMWNQGCNPPKEESILRELFEGLAKKETGKRVEGPENLVEKFEEEQSQTSFTLQSGFPSLDKSIGGFKSGGCYVITGLKKSGKSALVMNFLNNIMNEGKKVGFINTELGFKQFANRFAAIDADKSIKEVEGNPDMSKAWLKKNKEFLSYRDKKSIQDKRGFSKTALKKILDEWVEKDVSAVCVDNLTTFGTEAQDGKLGWQLLADVVDELVDFGKENHIVVFIVIHTKPQLIFTETSNGIQRLIEQQKLSDVFKKSVTVNRRPNSSDIYGGGGALSQISGGVLLLWRPFQDFNLSAYRGQAMLILEDFRDGSLLTEIDLRFELNKLKFSELFSVEENFEDLEEVRPASLSEDGPLFPIKKENGLNKETEELDMNEVDKVLGGKL